MATWYLKDPDGASLQLTVRPKAGRTAVGPVVAGRLKVQVTEPDQDGKANAAVIRVLAKRLGVRKESVRILAGRTGRRKTVRVEGRIPEELLDRMENGETK